MRGSSHASSCRRSPWSTDPGYVRAGRHAKAEARASPSPVAAARAPGRLHRASGIPHCSDGQVDSNSLTAGWPAPRAASLTGTAGDPVQSRRFSVVPPNTRPGGRASLSQVSLDEGGRAPAAGCRPTGAHRSPSGLRESGRERSRYRERSRKLARQWELIGGGAANRLVRSLSPVRKLSA